MDDLRRTSKLRLKETSLSVEDFRAVTDSDNFKITMKDGVIHKNTL